MAEVADRYERDHFLYRAFDERGELLYVGRTVNVAGRFTAHESSSPWFPFMARRELEGPMGFDEIVAAERTAIDTEHPAYNADEPHRRRVMWWRRTIYTLAASVAVHDGWQLNDVHDIADATAERLIRRLRTGDRFPVQMLFDAERAHGAFMGDPLPFVWLGYQDLIERDWVPEWPDRVQWRFIPERWVTNTMGNFSAQV
jgi:hypothetical protein